MALSTHTSRLTFVATLVAMTVNGFAQAKTLDGESARVDAPESDFYTLLNGSSLEVVSGGSVLDVEARSGSSVVVDGGTIQARGLASGLSLTDGSSARLSNATVTGGSFGATGALASTMSATGGSITGQSGVSFASGSTLDLAGTSVTGTSGVGAFILGSTLNASQGTTITGATSGIEMRQDRNTAAPEARVNLDGSTVVGQNGAAIVVRDSGNGNKGTAHILVGNKSQLSGSNGNILEVNRGMTADFVVDDSALQGDIVVDASSNADVTLRNQATLTGNMSNVRSLGIDNATWVLSQLQSDGVKDLSLNGGRVVLNTDGTVSGGFKTLTVDSLSGNGVFVMKVDLAESEGDKLVVRNEANGNHQLSVSSTGSEPKDGAKPQLLVQTGGGSAQFGLQNDVDRGAFVYTLEKGENDDNWYLVQKVDDGGGPIVTPGARVVLGLFSAAPTVWYGELSSLRTRMGELRLGQGQGVWMRSYGNRFNTSAGSGVAYQQSQSGLSVGADGAVPGYDGRWLVGVMGGYSESDLSFSLGSSGEVKSYYVGAYTTWMSDAGYYVDGVIKYSRFDNRGDVIMSDGVRSKGSYDNSGLGASIEVGKHIKLDGGWYVEPFTQLSTLWVGSDSYSLDNGLRARSDGADSVLGKMGAQFGRNVQLEGGATVQSYVKAAAAHEFIKGNKVRVNDNRFSNDLSGTRGEFAVGLAAQVSEVLQLHGEFQYSNGENIEQPYGVNLGLRYNF
ncbi:autotransporter outer membrane beta-barrel domain-containing protein [Pseudomonas sp. SC11]|uniref:autotransporter outer membrane beta-barrel domain-containing protein n=1 Tax=Pseudomonas sp. SC11 TaxID=326927 RepID=UPI00399BD40F